MRGAKKPKTCVRQTYHAMNGSTLNNAGLLDVGIYSGAPDGKNAPLSNPAELLQAKFVLCLDGSTLAGRLPGLLRAGQLVLRDDTSPLYGHFYEAMRPWVHYVPIARDSFADIFAVTQFLIANDALAEKIALEGQKFALKYTTREAAFCYIKSMLDTFATLMRHTPRPPGRRSVSLQEAIAQLGMEMKRTAAQEH